jgi:hypothetical protein
VPGMSALKYVVGYACKGSKNAATFNNQQTGAFDPKPPSQSDAFGSPIGSPDHEARHNYSVENEPALQYGGTYEWGGSC